MLRIRRTANAGLWLELDGVTVLLDGVCREVAPYLATPERIRQELTEKLPQVLAFTHVHPDHFDADYAKTYQDQTLRPILGPESVSLRTVRELTAGGVELTAVQTRHIGREGQEKHVSIVIEGSICVHFLGDASPLQYGHLDLPKPDVLIAPYAYANNPKGWQIARESGAKHLVLLHLPDRENDPYDLWDSVEKTLAAVPEMDVKIPEMDVKIPEMGETLTYFA